MNFAGFSGGKDSTAMVLRLAELGEPFSLIFTPAGLELPEVFEHVDNIARLTGRELIKPEGPSLVELMEKYQAIPNWRQRWCTKEVKIKPCQKYLNDFPGSTLFIVLRADEEEREGGRYYDVEYKTPLRDWGWGIQEVYEYLKSKGVTVPERTDCDCCWGQRLSEWYHLWRDWPLRYKTAEGFEEKYGHTWRSTGRDTWPASLPLLRKEFESGRIPRGIRSKTEVQGELFYDCTKMQRCRVCSL